MARATERVDASARGFSPTYGWMGRIAQVDLTSGKVTVEDLEGKLALVIAVIVSQSPRGLSFPPKVSLGVGRL